MKGNGPVAPWRLVNAAVLLHLRSWSRHTSRDMGNVTTSNLHSPVRAVITHLRFHHMILQTERCLGLEPLDVSSIASNISKVNVHRHNLSTH